MKTPDHPFTAIYTEWLDAFRGMLPGWHPTATPKEPTAKEAQVAANQEWEDEGGTVRPAEKPALVPAPAPKIPL